MTIIELAADIRASGISKIELSKLSGCISKGILTQRPDATFLASPQTHHALKHATKLDLDGFWRASGFHAFIPRLIANDHVPDNEIRVMDNGEHVASTRTTGYEGPQDA